MSDRKVHKKAITIEAHPGERDDETVARALLDPSFGAATTLPRFVSIEGRELDVASLAKELRAQCKAVTGGDLARAEAMLACQAHTLNMLFNVLATRASMNLTQYPDAADRYMRLALKAQGQCRATLETLANIKNPPMVIARQANVSHGGPMQVNNTLSTGARAENSGSTPTEESGGTHELLQDSRAQTASFGTDLALAAVGEVHGTADRRRESEVVTKPLARRTARAVPGSAARVERHPQRSGRGPR